ncbi:MAG TPA: hypothetical protein VFZ65_03105 [Planctomycetota bacterium]|nr:hypothetical protein [Planctomycetota bacterium]
MFDIVGVQPVVISGFDVNLTGTATIEVYKITAGTSYVGNEANPSAWTLLGTAANVVGAGPGVPTPVPLALNVPINPAQVQGFYVTTTAGTLTYTNGTLLGSVFAQNSDIQFLEGVGNAYPFGAVFSPRVWNGRIHYVPGAAGSFATKTLYGAGCYDRPRMAHEQFPGDTFPVDLANTQWTLIYQSGPTGGSYVIVPTGPAYDAVTPAANGVNLVTQAYSASSSASWDDASIVEMLPFALPYPNAASATVNSITVNSNGRIYLGSSFDASFASTGANSGYTPTSFRGTTGAGLPVLAGFMCDLDPVAGGNIWYEDPSPSGGVRITWHNVPNWQDPAYTGLPAQLNFIQMELVPGGVVFLSYGSSLGNGGSIGNVAIVGYSAGGAEPLGPQLDWSALLGYQTGTGEVALHIDANNRPITGTTINVIVSQIPASTLVAAVVYGLTKFDPGIPLAVLGMPGCGAHTTPDLLVTSIAPGATFQSPLSIPNNAALTGFHLLAQGLVLNASIPNTFGGITSNGLDLVIGTN